jgi:hypothetical protein
LTGERLGGARRNEAAKCHDGDSGRHPARKRHDVSPVRIFARVI